MHMRTLSLIAALCLYTMHINLFLSVCNKEIVGLVGHSLSSDEKGCGETVHRLASGTMSLITSLYVAGHFNC